MDGPILALWWVPGGGAPDRARGARPASTGSRADGPTEHAFTFARRFDPPAAA